MELQLSRRDLELLTQSLDHCIATCHSPKHGKSPGCEDCDAAADLNQRIKKALGKKEVKR
jgi:hypothetical protein